MSLDRIWVVGVGGIGSAIAGKLRPGGSCLLIDRWAEHVGAINAWGLRVEYPDESVCLDLPALHIGGLDDLTEVPDAILLAVKAPETRETVERLLPHMGDTTMVVSLQNGVNEDLIAGIVGAARTIGAVVLLGGAMVGPGQVRAYALEAGIRVGELDGSVDPRLRELADLVEPAIPVEVTNDIWGALWSKLMLNVQVNALCALTGRNTGEVARDPISRQLAIWLAREAITVAQALDISIDSELLDAEPDVYLRIDEDATALQRIERAFADRWDELAVKPSMLRDVEKNRPTEIEALNGYIARKGAETGVSVAVNQAVVDLIRLQEGGIDPRSLGGGLVQIHAGLVRRQRSGGLN